jgi:PAS domain S-box-containing protein
MQDKSMEELIVELRELKQKYDSLERMYASEIAGRDIVNRDNYRANAEELQRQRSLASGTITTEVDILKLNQELQLHQIELELQNEELRLVSNSLHESESQYKSLFIDNHSIMLLIDPTTGEIKDANKAACQYYGWSYAEICNKNISEINTLGPTELEETLQVAKTEKRKHFFFNHRLSSGEVRKVEVYSGLILVENTTMLYSIVHDITDRETAEEKLKLSEEKYRNIFETMLDAYYEAGLDGKLMDISPSIESISKGQYKRDELIGKTIDEVYFDFTEKEAFFNELNKYGKVTDYELALKNKDGSVVPVSISSGLIRDKEGKPVKIAGTIRDISARKLSDERLIENEEKYRVLFESMIMGVVYQNAEGFITVANPAAERILGLTLSQMQGLTSIDPLWKSIHEDGSDFPGETHPSMVSLRTGEEVRNVVMGVFNTTQSAYTWIKINAVPQLQEGEKKPIQVYTTFEDITERKLADDALKESELRYRNLANSGQALIWTATPDKKCDYFNQVWLDFTGRTKEQELGDGWVEGIHPEDLDRCLSIYTNSFDLRKSFSMDYRLRHHDGSYRWLQDDGKPRYNSHGEFIGYIGHCLDITERKQAVEKLDEKRKELAIANNQLTLAQQIGHTGSWTYNLKTRKLKGSIESLKLFGLGDNLENFTTENVESCIPERERVVQASYDLLKKGIPYNLEYEIHPADGSPTRIITSKSEIKNDDEGNAVELFGVFQDITERVHVEQTLKNNEEKFRAITEQTRDLIAISDEKGFIVYASASSMLIFGISPEDMVGKNFIEFVADPDTSRAMADFNNLMGHGGIIQDIEFRMKRNDGTTFIGELTGSNFNTGIENGVLVTIRDISERKLAEEALIASEEKYRLLFYNNPQPMWIYDIETLAFLEVNQSAISHYGYSRPEFLNMTLKDIRPAEEIPALLKDIELSINNMNSQSEWTHLRKNKEFIVVEVTAQSLVFNGRSARHVLINDITERKKAEESFKKLSQAVEQSPVMTYITGISGLIEYANPKVIEITGYSIKELLGQNPRIFSSGEKSREEYQILWQTINAGKDWRGEFHNKKKSGEYYWVSATISPITDTHGKIMHYLATEQDITDRKYAEENIKQQNDRLNAIISAMPDLIFVIDKEGTYTEFFYANPLVLPIPESDIIGTNLSDFFGIAKAGEYLQYIHTCIRDKKLITYEYAVPEEHGLHYFEARIAPYGKDKILSVVRDVTVNKEKETEVKKLSLAVSQSPVSIVITDTRGDIEYVNPAFELATGYKFEEVKGKNPRVLKSGKMEEAIYRELWESITGGKEWHGEWINKKKNGEFYWEEISITPVYGKNGEISNYLAVKQDITQRKQSEKALKESEEKYHRDLVLLESIFNSPIKIIIFSIDKDYCYTKFSVSHKETMKKIWGVDIQIGMNMLDLITNPEDRKKAKNNFDRALNGDFYILTEEYGDKEFARIYYDNYYNPINDDEGNIIGISVFVLDVTERKQAEFEIVKLNTNLELTVNTRTAQYKEALGRLEKIADRVPGVVYQFQMNPDGSTCFPFSSEGIREIYRVSPEEVIEDASAVFANLHPDDFESVKKSIQDSANKLELWQYEYRVKFEDGTIRWLSGNGMPQREADGSVLWHGFISDITERMQVEAELTIEKQRLDLIITGNHLGTWEWNVQTGETIFNEQWASLIGYTLEEILPINIKTWRLLTHPDDLKNSDRLLEKHFKGKSEDSYSCETRMKHKNGTWVWILDRGKVHTWDKEGKPLIMSGTHLNINALKHAEEELANEKQRLASILEGTNVGTWEWNVQTGETVFNESWAEIIGFTLEEISPVSIETWMKFAHPDDLKVSGELLDKHFKGEMDYYAFESRMKHKDGNWVWVLDRGKVHEWDTEGKPLLMSGTHQEITERKDAEEALKASEIKHSTMISNISDVIGIVGIDGIIKYKSPNIEKFFGWHPSDLIGLDGWQTVHPDDLERIQNEFFSLTDQAAKTVEYKYKCKDGGYKLIELTATNLINNPVIKGILLNYHDITERKQAEDELRWNQSLLSFMSSASPLGFLVVDNRTDDILYFNHRFCEIWEIQQLEDQMKGGELKNNDIIPYCLPVLADVPAFAESCKPLQYEDNRVVVEDEIAFTENRTVRRFSTQIRGTKDEYYGRFYIFEDITKRKLSEEALKESETRFSLFMDYLPAVVFMKDYKGKTLFVNKYMDEAFGASAWMGKNMLEVFPNEIGEKLMADDINSMEAGYQKIEESLMQLDGRLHYYETQKFIIERSGQESWLGGVSLDITDRKLAEAEILKAKNEAENANHAKSEFLSRMSHELRTPMNSILGFAQLMEMIEVEEANKKRLNHILTSGKHLLNLINEVLDIAGIESGKQILMIQPVLLSGILDEIIDVVQVAANKKNVTIKIEDPPSTHIYALADQLRIKQVLLNLVSNAIKYNREDGTVTIKAELQAKNREGNNTVRISISDTGTGIQADDISKLFQPFERIGAAKTGIEGTGLGLMVVKKFTEAMGGGAGVESEPGVGSTFWIELPQTDITDHFKGQKADGDQQNEIQKDGKVATVLYIEDNLSNIELVEEILKAYRTSIKLVTSIYGKQTVQLAKDHQAKFILLDQDLPDIKGDKIMEELKADKETKNIPVIMVSADAMPQQIEKLIKTGAAAYLTKPLDVVQFLKIIDQYSEI